MTDFTQIHIAIVCLINDAFAPPGAGWIGGGQVGVYENGRYLVSQGARVTYILRQAERGQPKRQRLGPRCSILRVPGATPGGGKPSEMGDSVTSMVNTGLRMLQDETDQPDLVQSQYWIGGALGQAISSALSIRHVHFFLSLGRLTDPLSSQPSPQQRLRDSLELQIYHHADCLVAQSVFMAEQFKTLYPEISHDRVSIIHHGIDHNQFSKRPESAGDYFRRSSSRFS